MDPIGIARWQFDMDWSDHSRFVGDIFGPSTTGRDSSTPALR